MSYELDYFPPSKTRLKWSSKALNYSPWVCDVLRQTVSHRHTWPASVVAYVDKVSDKFVYTVEVCDWRMKRVIVKEKCLTALEACLSAEKVGKKHVKKLFPGWVKTSLENGWRPPGMASE